MIDQAPEHSPGVVQRVVHQGEDIGLTEYLANPHEPLEWTRDPIRAHVFRDDQAKTGFERAEEFVGRLKADAGPLSFLFTAARREVKRPVNAPAMPAGFYARGRAERAHQETHEAPHDWREGKPNCGTD